MGREAFQRLVTADQPEAPEDFAHDAILDLEERPSLDAALATTRRPLPLEEVLALGGSGAQLPDVRDGIDVEEGLQGLDRGATIRVVAPRRAP